MRRKSFPLQLQEWVSTTYCSGNAHFPHMDTFFISRSGIMGISAPLNQSEYWHDGSVSGCQVVVRLTVPGTFPPL